MRSFLYSLISLRFFCFCKRKIKYNIAGKTVHLVH